MHTVTVEYAKTHLTELLEEVAAGEDIVIESNNRPLARLVAERVTTPETATSTSSAKTVWPVLGMLKGKVWMANDFDAIPEGFEEYVK